MGEWGCGLVEGSEGGGIRGGIGTLGDWGKYLAKTYACILYMYVIYIYIYAINFHYT